MFTIIFCLWVGLTILMFLLVQTCAACWTFGLKISEAWMMYYLESGPRIIHERAIGHEFGFIYLWKSTYARPTFYSEDNDFRVGHGVSLWYFHLAVSLIESFYCNESD